jgi:hypothetical protein
MAVDRKARLAIRQIIRAIDYIGKLLDTPDSEYQYIAGLTETPHKGLREQVVALLSAESQVDPDEAE